MLCLVYFKGIFDYHLCSGIQKKTILRKEKMSNICIHVGNQIRYFRKLRGISLKEFSLLLNKSISTISKYENGSISVDIQTLEKIAHILGVTLEQLLPFATPTVTR